MRESKVKNKKKKKKEKNYCHRKMTQLCRKLVGIKIRWSIFKRVSVLGEYFVLIWDTVVGSCSCGKPVRYRRLTSSPPPSLSFQSGQPVSTCIRYDSDSDSESDLVSLKITVLGDCQIGKTSFLIKYIGDQEGRRCLDTNGLNLKEKTIFLRGARISFNLWEVRGDNRWGDQVPIACKDAVAILFMFDLTSRSTLYSVIEWYSEARKWNQSAIPILIGTKFDDFVRLPLDIQWTIVTQARGYARAMKATLFFSSATHNINVNKIFKFIMAKLFNLQWSLTRNLTPGEPIIDF